MAALLEEQNFVIVDMQENMGGKQFNDHHQNSSWLIQLAQSNAADAGAAAARGDTERFLELLLLNIRLAAIAGRGGWEFDTSMSCRSSVIDELTKVRKEISPTSIRSVLAALDRADHEQENRALVLQRAQAAMERGDGWKRRFVIIFRKLAGLDPLELDGYQDMWRQTALFENLVIGELAIRLFQAERGRLPEGLVELVPDYLAAAPNDPFTKSLEPLRYRVSDGDFVLYSVGKDGVDNGGRFAGRQTYGSEGYDYDIDMPRRP